MMSARYPSQPQESKLRDQVQSREVGPALTPRQFDNLDRRYWNKYLNSTKDKR